MDQNDREQLCAFFRRSRYDIIQARQSGGWGPVFTFAPSDTRAAQRAGQMMVRMHRDGQLHLRHARRARLQDRHRHVAEDVVVVTEFAEAVRQTQEVIGLENATALRVDVYLQDDALAALEAEFVRSGTP